MLTVHFEENDTFGLLLLADINQANFEFRACFISV